jgi:hypothetical protein
MFSRLLASAGLILVAVLAIAWLSAGLVATQAQSEGAAIVDEAGAETPRAEVARGLDLLHDAQWLNADKEPDVNEVILLAGTGSEAESLQKAERLVQVEPENVNTWFALWAASLAAGEPRLTARALAEVRKLDPFRARVLKRFEPKRSTG